MGGSFAHGGWDIYSDVDFIVVIEQDLKPINFDALRVLHAKIFIRKSYWAKHMEGSYIPANILKNLKKTVEPVWYLDNGSLNFERSTHDNTLVVRWVLRERGIKLVGSDPQEFIPKIPEVKLKAEVFNTMRSWGREILENKYQIDNRWAQAYAVVSYCRMLHSLSTGRVDSKPAGTAWAKAALDAGWVGLIEDALSARPDQYQKFYEAADKEKVLQTKEFIHYALEIAPASM